MQQMSNSIVVYLKLNFGFAILLISHNAPVFLSRDFVMMHDLVVFMVKDYNFSSFFFSNTRLSCRFQSKPDN